MKFIKPYLKYFLILLLIRSENSANPSGRKGKKPSYSFRIDVFLTITFFVRSFLTWFGSRICWKWSDPRSWCLQTSCWTLFNPGRRARIQISGRRIDWLIDNLSIHPHNPPINYPPTQQPIHPSLHLRYRGYKIPEDNVALPRHGATVLVGEVKTALLDGDSKNYDMERGFSRWRNWRIYCSKLKKTQHCSICKYSSQRDILCKIPWWGEW